ncbi:hypothetical protein [Paenibacillus macerans]|uniref:hypothetical protein n=1 Tax=Paenibacillus macerans TaxID=44252 RepID=UPI003D31A18D
MSIEMKSTPEISTLVKPTPEMLASRRAQVKQMYPHARVFTLDHLEPVLQINSHVALLQSAPQTITLITPDHDDHSRDQLFIGHVPIARANWNYDPDTCILTFRQGHGDDRLSGEFRMVRDRTSGFGALQIGKAAFAAELHAKPVTYTMKSGLDAAYVAGDNIAPQLKWDEQSARWTGAAWSGTTMTFTYGIVKEGSIAGQDVYYVSCVFTDADTQETWDPGYGNYSAYITSDFVLNFALNNGVTPQPDPSNPFSRFQSTRFPYILTAKLDAFAQHFTGSMLCGQRNLEGAVYGVQGVYDQSAQNGMYELRHDGMPEGADSHLIGLHGGTLVIDQQPVEQSVQTGNLLQWTGLPPELMAKTGLPESGYLKLSADGTTILEGVGGAHGRRVSPEEAASLAEGIGHLPVLQAVLHRMAAPYAATADAGLNFMDLVNMDQFVRDEKGGWYDAVQQDSMEDFYSVLLYNMDEGMRKQFITPNPPDLDPTVKGIAGMKGSKGTSPSTWYNTLSTAYLTTLLSKTQNDPATKYLNARRADKWLRKQTGLSDVFSVQGPALYNNRWLQKFTGTTAFKNDQLANKAKYAPLIDQDLAAWKEQMKQSVEATDQQMTDLMKTLDDIGAKAKEGNYWTYVVFKYATNPAFLNMLQTISFNPDGVDGSEFMRRIQRTSAVLNVLDESSFFTKEFVYVIQMFQTANILPQLIDYSGNLEDYSYAVNAIITKFIETYLNGTDPDMQKAAQEFSKMQEQKLVADLMLLFQQTSVNSGGLYNWGQLMSNFESKVVQFFGNTIPKLAVLGVGMAAAAYGIVGFATGQIKWKDLPWTQQSGIVMVGVGVLAQLVVLVVRRAVAVSVLFSANSGFTQALRLFFSPKLLGDAQMQATSGFRRWLLSDGGVPQVSQGFDEFGIAAMVARVETEADIAASSGAVRWIFGRNMNEFIATRVGAIMAVAGLVYSAISLHDAINSMHPNDLEIAANALFVAASALEVIAVGGAWIAGGLGVASSVIAGGLTVGAFFSILSGIAILAMIAGAILLIVYLSKPQPSPIEEFAKKQAKDAGYYMPHGTDIDYFAIFQPDSGPQLAGLSLLVGNGPACLQMKTDGTVNIGVMDHTAATAFYLEVDEFGRATFVAPLADENGQSAARVLTLNEQGQVVAAESITDAAKLQQQQWYAEVQSDPVLDGDGRLLSAKFALYANVTNSDNTVTKHYLAIEDGADVVGSSEPYAWSLQMVSTGPQGLHMSDIELKTYNKDTAKNPALIMPGSSPRNWSIMPSLPEFMTFEPATGTIAQKVGVAPPLFPPTVFTLSVSNAVGNASTKFSLSVVNPPQGE